MLAANKHPTSIAAVIYIAAFFLFAPPAAAGPADQIESLAKKANQTIDSFMRQSLELRLKYQFFGKLFADDDNQKLRQLAEHAAVDLQQTVQAQQKLKQQIESYDGPDWDSRYGQTGLWRKLFEDVYSASLSRYRIDLCRAISSKQPKRKDILRDIIAQIDALDETRTTPDANLIKAKALVLLSQTESEYKMPAERQLTSLEEQHDLMCRAVFETALEKIKLLGAPTPEKIKKLVQTFAESNCAGSIDLAVMLTSILKTCDHAGFEKMVTADARLESLIGSFLLSDLPLLLDKDPAQVTTFEADLAVLAAWKNNLRKHKTLLQALADNPRYRTALVLYVLALATTQDEPSEAIDLLIKASQLREKHEKSMLEIPPTEIAAKAAHLACALPNQKQQNCPLVLEAFDNYCSIAGEKLDADLEYLHTVVLTTCRQLQKAKTLLRKIADSGAAKYSNRAEFDLIMLEMRQPIREPQRKQQLLEQLKSLIEKCSAPNEKDPELRTEALAIYCSTLLESKDNTSAQRVLDALTKADTDHAPNLLVFESRALMRLGRLGESAQYMVAICAEDRRNNHIFGAESLLRQIIDNIDQLQQSGNDFAKLVEDSMTIARHCYKVATTTYGLISVDSAGLYLAELSVFASSNDAQRLSEIEQLLVSLPKVAPRPGPDLIRCKARLLMAQGKSDDAAKLWAYLAEIHKSAAKAPNTRGPKWWRARYFQLYCSYTPAAAKNIAHTIDVLQNSFTDIPAFWAEKLDSLKRRCEDAPVRGHSASYLKLRGFFEVFCGEIQFKAHPLLMTM